MTAELHRVFSRFAAEGNPLSFTPCRVGLINSTFFVKTDKQSYVLQKLNTAVFKKPQEVMANIGAVTAHLQKKGLATLSFIETKDGSLLCEDESGFWRLSLKIEGDTYDAVTPAQLEAGARAFGAFQNALVDFDASLLFETIPDFHNTPARIEALWEAVATAPNERIAAAKDTVPVARQFASQASYITSLLKRGDLPLRVVHNDTKLNNVLFGKNGESVVLDLDTVMPGSLLFDFGDALRSGASTRPEGALDFENIAIDKTLYEAFLKGFLEGSKGTLTPNELKLLPFSVFTLAYELGVRFLTDYLNGDVYFRTSYPDENLNRAKGQLALAQNVFFRLDELSALTQKYI